MLKSPDLPLPNNHKGVPSYKTDAALFTMFLTSQGKYAEAGSLFERTQIVREKALGPGHEDVASVLRNRALLLNQQV